LPPSSAKLNSFWKGVELFVSRYVPTAVGFVSESSFLENIILNFPYCFKSHGSSSALRW